jgi:hypothetical protein
MPLKFVFPHQPQFPLLINAFPNAILTLRAPQETSARHLPQALPLQVPFAHQHLHATEAAFRQVYVLQQALAIAAHAVLLCRALSLALHALM